MIIKISTVKNIRLYVRQIENKEEKGKKRGGRENNKTALSTFSFTRDDNYFDYIREKASILC